MPAIFATFSALLATYRYPLLFTGAFVEGPILMMTSGLLLRLGQFSFFPLYFSLMLGDFFADIVWYAIGRYAAEPFLRRFGHVLGITHKVFEKMEHVFQRHDVKILFISKITMGFGFALATILAAGAVRVPFKKYLAAMFLGGFIWTGMLLSVGYFLGNLYAQVADGFKVVFLVATVVTVGAGLFGVMTFIRSHYNKIKL